MPMGNIIEAFCTF